MAAAETPECGPCRDKVFTALKSTVPPALSVPMAALPLLALHVALAAAARAVGPHFYWAGEPPGKRHPILRC